MAYKSEGYQLYNSKKKKTIIIIINTMIFKNVILNYNKIVFQKH